MTKEKSGWDKYYQAKQEVDEKLLFSVDEMKDYAESMCKMKIIFVSIVCFLLGALSMGVLAVFFPSIL